MKTPLIEFRSVSKRFGEKVVLDQASLTIYPGEVTTIIGKSGVGKSVTLKLIIGLLDPDEGDILYKGKSLARMSRTELLQMRREVNFMFQNNALFDSLTIYENIALPLLEMNKLEEKEIRKQVLSKMEALELLGLEDKYPSQLSGGMQKRVALARALVTDPGVVLFDEPTTGLDPIRKNYVLSMIAFHQRNFGFSAVLVSHDVPDVFYVSNRLAVLDAGKIVYEGPPEGMETIQHPVIYGFIASLEKLKNESIGLLTRWEFESEWKEMSRQGPDQEMTCFILTVHNFERIRECLGHLIGQKLIGRLAMLIQEFMSDQEYVLGRLSIDRIIGFLSGRHAHEVKQLFSFLEQRIQDPEFARGVYGTMCCVRAALSAGLVQGPVRDFKALVEDVSQEEKILVNLDCDLEECSKT